VITQYNSTNAEKYNRLFARASDALGVDDIYALVNISSQDEFMQNILDGYEYFTKVDGVYTKVATGATFDPTTDYYMATSGIQTLEQYFCHLGDLLDLHNGYKYIMLPLDEAPLDINANTREISIPNSFRTAGLSVQGDELAETLFFRIDRFFDAMDLSTCEIYVHWSLADGDAQATPIYMVDVESEPGKLIFACPLTSEITRLAGAIELAVCFLKRGSDNTIVYNLNTKPVRATIGASLKFNTMNYIEEDRVSTLLAAAIDNSDMASGEPAPVPVFTKYLGNGSPTGLTQKYFEGETCVLDVEASVTHGTLSYEWYHTPERGAWARKLDEDDKSYTVVIDEDNLVDIEDANHANNTKTGVYQVRAINRLNNKTSKIWSDKVEFPAPMKPVLVDMNHTVLEGENVTLTINEATDTH
jgi:hypothetical protein